MFYCESQITDPDPAPPQSPAEIKAMEETASATVQGTIFTCVVLYISTNQLYLSGNTC